MNTELFTKAFLKPCEPFRKNVGILLFEFSKFYQSDYQHGRDFVSDLDKFLGHLPSGWPYGVEIRNRNFLHPEYFAVLKQHGATHVFNSWAEMPSVKDQLTLGGSRTNPTLCAARFLLKPGRKYEESVKLFEPYDKVKDPNRMHELRARCLSTRALTLAGDEKHSSSSITALKATRWTASRRCLRKPWSLEPIKRISCGRAAAP